MKTFLEAKNGKCPACGSKTRTIIIDYYEWVYSEKWYIKDKLIKRIKPLMEWHCKKCSYVEVTKSLIE